MIKVTNWTALLECLDKFSSDHGLGWIVDKRCAVDVLDDLESAESTEYIDVRTGHVAYLCVDDLKGVEIS